MGEEVNGLAVGEMQGFDRAVAAELVDDAHGVDAVELQEQIVAVTDIGHGRQGITVAEIDLVAAGIVIDRVEPAGDHIGVVAVAAIERVVAEPARQLVVATETIEPVMGKQR